MAYRACVRGRIKDAARLALTAALGLCALQGLHASPASAAATDTWCWSMDGGGVRGTITTGTPLPGDGTAPAGQYTMTGFSVYASTYPQIEIGSTVDGMYRLGTQPVYAFRWNGTAPTEFSRASGLYTNGFGAYGTGGGNGAYLVFNIGYQKGSETEAGPQYFYAAVTPTMSPAAADGSCPGQSAPSSGGGAPADVLEQVGRRSSDDACANGWSPSYAAWMNDGRGGWVCTRTLWFDVRTSTWAVR